MGKVYPNNSLSPSPTSTSSCLPCSCSRAETFTVWMKSLIYNSNGCTVFDSNGDIVYRIDNYDVKHSYEVHLMDLRGRVLCTIRRKKFSMIWCWEGFRYDALELIERKPWFRVKKSYGITMGKFSSRKVIVGREKEQLECFRIEGCRNKASCRIVDQNGGLVAEVMKKETTSGIRFGDDVMRLVVEPNVDHSLVMSFVIVYNLTNHKI